MRLFLDTNVILDIFMRREPFYAASAQVVYLWELGQTHWKHYDVDGL